VTRCGNSAGARGGSKTTGPTSTRSSTASSFGLQHRTEAVTETTLDQLGVSGELSPAKYDVVVDVRGSCQCDGEPGT